MDFATLLNRMVEFFSGAFNTWPGFWSKGLPLVMATLLLGNLIGMGVVAYLIWSEEHRR